LGEKQGECCPFCSRSLGEIGGTWVRREPPFLRKTVNNVDNSARF